MKPTADDVDNSCSLQFNKDDAYKSLVKVGYRFGGMGVLCRGKYVLTAAHCLAPGGWLSFTEPFYTSFVGIFRGPWAPTVAKVLSYEPCQDLALLSFDYEHPDPPANESNSKFLDQVSPAESVLDRPLQDGERVWICGSDGEWVTGTAQVCSSEVYPPFAIAGRVTLDNARPFIPKGTSGSPAFTVRGEVCGIVSTVEPRGVGPRQAAPTEQGRRRKRSTPQDVILVLPATALPLSAIRELAS